MVREKVYVPPIKIQGIKTKSVPLIRETISLEADAVWIEPFMGSGVVGFNVAAPRAIFADVNPYIVEFYNGIKRGEINADRVRAFLEQEGALLEAGDDAYYYEVRRRFNETHQPLDFLFLNRSCFNGMIRFNKKHEFNVPYGHKPHRFAKAYITKICNQVKYLEEQLRDKDWVFLCQSFETTIRQAPAGAFIYCDPPFIGRHVDYYDSWDEAQEYSLRNELVSSGLNFMLSTWDYNQYRRNEYIDLVWGFCQKISHNHFYHVGAREANRQPIVEALLINHR
ncbi:site-specific DNA-methyltransferase (adenine-specific) [Oscillospiraceae bacterium]|nr:site-specific DNA-methyltransferase (adenine-specific) [Oscillospiraceae bacterium]BDF73655.1 site-specific DNA-methyltransferase (adenine-specific) [Oscillospiraceae bacterium]